MTTANFTNTPPPVIDFYEYTDLELDLAIGSMADAAGVVSSNDTVVADLTQAFAALAAGLTVRAPSASLVWGVRTASGSNGLSEFMTAYDGNYAPEWEATLSQTGGLLHSAV